MGFFIMDKVVRGSCNDFLTRGVYHLYNHKTVVYVGMSNTCCMSRIVNHFKSKDKQFTHFRIFSMKDAMKVEIEDREKAMIQRHLPKYNVVHSTPNNEIWKSKQDNLKDKARKRINKLPNDIPIEFEDRFFKHIYSRAWIDKHNKVLSERRVCERCNGNKPIGVFHKNWSSVFNELDKDLIAVCGFCKAKYKYKY